MDIDCILGFPLEEGIKILSTKTSAIIEVKKTRGLNKNFSENLSEPRIIRVTKCDNSVLVVYGYFNPLLNL